MKTLAPVCTLLAVVACSPLARAESVALSDKKPDAAPTPPTLDASKTGPVLGFSIHRFQDDFALGATASTPRLGQSIRLTLGGGIAWYPYATTSESKQKWEPFYHTRLVIEVGPPAWRGVPVRPYSFGGATMLILPDALSSTRLAFGGIGGFGAEFSFLNSEGNMGPVTYYFELGGIGTSGSAKKLPLQPSIANGFVVSAGFRGYL